MGPFDAFWHLGNFFVIPLAMGLLASGLAKGLWRRELQAVRWPELASWVAGAATVVQVGGLVLQGRDGKMSTYVVMVIACAITLWWRGWRRNR